MPVLKRKRLPIQTIVLRTLYVTGLMGVSLVAPKATKLFKYLDQGKMHRKEVRERISQALHRLEKKGFVALTGTRGERRASLTANGEKAIETILLREYEIPEQAVWDGKWRVVIFDVREKKRARRDHLRLLLGGAGFVRLQHSVWVQPYPCDEFIQLVRAHLASGTGEMLSFVVEGLEKDSVLRKHFRLD